MKLFLAVPLTVVAAALGVSVGAAGASSPLSVAPTSAHAGSAGSVVASAVGPKLASNTVFFSNLGPGGSFQHGGWCVTGATAGCTGRFDIAMPFVPSVNGRVTRIDIAITNLSGPNSATVLLAQDDGSGLPGHVLGSWPISNQPAIGVSCCPTTVSLPVSIAIGARRTYWVIARAGTTSTWDNWNWNYAGTQGPYAYSTDGTSWNYANSTIGAFDVIGCSGVCHT